MVCTLLYARCEMCMFECSTVSECYVDYGTNQTSCFYTRRNSRVWKIPVVLYLEESCYVIFPKIIGHIVWRLQRPLNTHIILYISIIGTKDRPRKDRQTEFVFHRKKSKPMADGQHRQQTAAGSDEQPATSSAHTHHDKVRQDSLLS